MIQLHTSHLLRSLDLLSFKRFRKNWETNLRKSKTSDFGQPLNKIDLWHMFSISTKDRPISIQSLLTIPQSSMFPRKVTDNGKGEGNWVFSLLVLVLIALDCFFNHFYLLYHRKVLDYLHWTTLCFWKQNNEIGVYCIHCIA